MRLERASAFAALLAMAISLSAVPARGEARLSQLASGVYLFEHDDPTKAGVTVCNLVVAGRDSILIADGQGTVANTQELIAAVRDVSSVPIRFVVVGSEHADHRGGDAAFDSTVTFVAHPRSIAALERQASAPNRRPNAPPVVVPGEAVSGWRTFDLGAREVRVGFLGRAHTGGDLVVYLPREGIVYTSEVFISGIFPSMANGFPTEWVSTLKAVEALGATTFVPAHGLMGTRPGMTRAALVTYREALERVIAEGQRLHDEGVSLADAPRAARLGPFAQWHRYTENLPGALGRVYQELDAQLPVR